MVLKGLGRARLVIEWGRLLKLASALQEWGMRCQVFQQGAAGGVNEVGSCPSGVRHHDFLLPPLEGGNSHVTRREMPEFIFASTEARASFIFCSFLCC